MSDRMKNALEKLNRPKTVKGAIARLAAGLEKKAAGPVRSMKSYDQECQDAHDSARRSADNAETQMAAGDMRGASYSAQSSADAAIRAHGAAKAAVGEHGASPDTEKMKSTADAALDHHVRALSAILSK